jgi:O-antigen/teichoic acid export membrane protein
VALRKSIRKISLLFVSGSVAYFVCIVLFGRWLMVALYAGRYVQVAYLLPLAVLPLLMAAASQGPGIALGVMQAPSKVFWGYAVAAALTILVGVPLTRYRGLLGAISAMVISSSASLALVVYYYKTELKRVTDVDACGER